MTLSGYDAAYPPGQPPTADQVVLGYGGGDTPHVWSLADWNSQPARFRIPIWTRSNPAGHDGAVEAAQFLAYLDSVGAPRGILTALDYETAVDAVYVVAFDTAMIAGGNKVALYGSTSTLFQNPKPSGGYFPADLTGQPHLYPGTLITQYRFESAWDDDTISAGAVLWDTQEADMTPDQANTLDQISNAIFNGGTSTGETPPGASSNSLVNKLDDIMNTVHALSTPDPAAFVAALAANPDAITKFGTAVAAALPPPPTVDQIAAAVAAHFSGDLKQG